MKVFLSWSGSKSKGIAEALRNWLPKIIQAVDPWMSVDIEKGQSWSPEIAAKLEESRVGIICLCRENLESKWLHFEAGALSKTNDARTCTLLVDVKPSDVQQPLAQFQHTLSTKDDILKLLHTINVRVKELGETSPTEVTLNAVFEALWPELEQTLILTQKASPKSLKPSRTESDILEEILQAVRSQERRQQDMQSKIDSLFQETRFFENVYDPSKAGLVSPGGDDKNARQMQLEILRHQIDNIEHSRIIAERELMRIVDLLGQEEEVSKMSPSQVHGLKGQQLILEREINDLRETLIKMQRNARSFRASGLG